MTQPTLEWIKQTGEMNSTDSVYRPVVATDAAGNTYMVYFNYGVTSGNSSAGDRDVSISKFDSNGNLLWIKQDPVWNTSSSENRPMVSITADGYIVFAFWTNGTVSGETSTGGNDIVVVKVDSDGNTIWVKQDSTFNTTDDDYRPAICCTSDNGIVVAYMSQGTISGETSLGIDRLVVFKMDSSGTVAWITENADFNPITSYTDAYYPPSITTDGTNVYATYYTGGVTSGNTSTGNDDIVVVKLDASGNTQWVVQNETFNTPDYDFYPLISAGPSALYIAFITEGTTSGNSNVGDSDIAVARLNPSNGSVMWIKQSDSFDTTNGDAASYHFGLCVDGEENAYIAFHTYGVLSGSPNNNDSAQIIVAKFTPAGVNEWSWQIPDSIIVTNNSYTPTISVDSARNLYVSFLMYSGSVSGGTDNGTGNMAVLFKLSQGADNSFPLLVSPYLARNNVLVFTKAAVDALVAHAPLPVTMRVSWAPNGVPAGSLLRNTGRTAVVSVSNSNPLAVYRFQSVQLIAGAGSEGVGGSSTDTDPWQCGYICTWAADGIAPIF